MFYLYFMLDSLVLYPQIIGIYKFFSVKLKPETYSEFLLPIRTFF